MEHLLLGIDIGTTGAKAALFSVDGHLEAVHAVEYPTHHIRPGWVEQQPEDWWNATCAAIQHVLGQTPQARDRILGIATSAQAPTLLALDEAGQPLRPALIWMDRRAEAEVQELNERIGAEHIYQITGNRSDPFYVAAKLRWLNKYEPDVMRRTRTFIQIPGYINLRLTGSYSLDSAHAALLQLRDYATGDWSAALCEACGVSPDQFPPIYPGHHQLGEVTAQAAAATGLRPGTPVMVGTVDGAAAAVEAGVAEAGVAAEMTGTSTVLLMPNTSGITESAFIAMPHALPNLHLLLGAMVSSGASLRWYREQFGNAERSDAQQTDDDIYELMTQQAARIPNGSNGLIFLPYMMGERSPIWHTQARGVLFGLTLSTSRGAIIRAILEGTAFALRHNIEVARKAGVQVTEIRSVGGGTRNRLWNQIKADILGLPILLPEASVGAPFGDAVLAGLGLGLYPDVLSALREMVHIRTVFDPDPEHAWRHSRLYAIYRSLYEHVREDFNRLAEVP